MARHVLIIGCGQLGSRHLQAVVSLPDVQSIDVFDPHPEGLHLGQTRVNEVADRKVQNIRWLSRLDDAKPNGDLCIVATRADVRCGLVCRAASEKGYHSFLIEKIVAQSVAEYIRLIEFSESLKLSIWVNCKTRAHWSHQRVKSRLDPNAPLVLTAQGGNHGLANNGIHAADLFAFYDDAEAIECLNVQIDPELQPSKRGIDMFDLSGTMLGRSRRGSQFLLNYSGEQNGPGYFTVVSANYRALIDDSKKAFYESTAETGWVWTPVPFNVDLNVSAMTRAFAENIFANGQCDLPTLTQCYPAHEFILTALQPHFNVLLGVDADHCPVT